MENTKFFAGSVKHCKFVFDTLIAKLSHKPLPAWPADLSSDKTPLFVSYHTLSHDLRGCIGTFSPEPTKKLLPQYALVAALKDSRFPPISMSEVPNLIVEISFLTQFEPGFKAYDWEMGKHGITINFKANGRDFQATYLPHVPPMFKGKEDCMKSLIQKTGFTGNWKTVVDSLEVTRYQSSIVELSYPDYQKLE